MRAILHTALLAAVGLALGACNVPQAATPVKNAQAQKAAQAANSIQFTDNSEIDNIKARIELTSKPGALGFITLLNQAGQPILYEGVRGKVTSGAKRLTRPYEIRKVDCGQYACDKDLVSPSDEGTYGQSGDYVFYWNTKGEYRQWAGGYLYSDKPYRLNVQPLVITTEHADAAKPN